jgi:hypothetical protein
MALSVIDRRARYDQPTDLVQGTPDLLILRRLRSSPCGESHNASG